MTSVIQMDLWGKWVKLYEGGEDKRFLLALLRDGIALILNQSAKDRYTQSTFAMLTWICDDIFC